MKDMDTFLSLARTNYFDDYLTIWNKSELVSNIIPPVMNI